MLTKRQAPGLIRGIAAIEELNSSPHALPAMWTDCDTGDLYEGAISNDSEWAYINRVSQSRAEVVTFAIPREQLAHLVRQLGGKLD